MAELSFDGWLDRLVIGIQKNAPMAGREDNAPMVGREDGLKPEFSSDGLSKRSALGEILTKEFESEFLV